MSDANSLVVDPEESSDENYLKTTGSTETCLDNGDDDVGEDEDEDVVGDECRVPSLHSDRDPQTCLSSSL